MYFQIKLHISKLKLVWYNISRIAYDTRKWSKTSDLLSSVGNTIYKKIHWRAEKKKNVQRNVLR